MITFVLVHGALFTGSVWSDVDHYLNAHGAKTVVVNVPGRNQDGVNPAAATLDLAAKKVCAAVRAQKGPVILVGHSQGGAIITQSSNDCGKDIKALVYIAAVVPQSGEGVFKALSGHDNANFDACATFNPLTQSYEVYREGPIRQNFMADVSAAKAKAAIAGMVAEPALIGSAKLQFNEKQFKQMPKYYIETTQDKIISWDTQKKIAAKWQWNKRFTLQSSHSPFLSQPELLGSYLLQIGNNNSYKK